MSRAAFAIGDLREVQEVLQSRMKELSEEVDGQEFVMPIGLCMVVPRSLGGDAVAQELIKRFGLLGFTSKKLIDFYFLGWRISRPDHLADVEFDEAGFASCYDGLRNVGVKRFGYNADLILVDAYRARSGEVSIDFSEAIRIDLSVAVKEKKIINLGSFLAELLEAAEAIRDEVEAFPDRSTFHISDRLGLLIARKSLLAFFLKTWGKIIGADKIEAVVTQNIGPLVNLAAFSATDKDQ